MNWAALILGLLDIARLLLAMAAKRQGLDAADLEKLRESYRNWGSDLDAAAAARAAVRDGTGVLPPENDPWNRDNSSPRP